MPWTEPHALAAEGVALSTTNRYPGEVRSTRVDRHVRAPRAAVYAALLDRDAVQEWMVPTGMTSHIHEFDAREGGVFRISLTYDDPNGSGKTNSHTDTHHGRFVKLIPDALVVQVVEFETANPAMQGEMTITYSLHNEPGGTLVRGLHDGIPPGVPLADNELGWNISLGKLAEWVERGRPGPTTTRKTTQPLADALPARIGKPATRGLNAAGITCLNDLRNKSEKDLLALHGVGPKAIRLLNEALQQAGLPGLR